MEITDITLSGALPSVFRGDSPVPSEVWRTQITFTRGERYIIAAESGTGKSSLCAYIFGARRDYEGTISFNGTDIRSFSIPEWQEIRRSSIAYLPQELGLFPELTAMENIALKNDLTRCFERKKIESLLERFGIATRRDFPVGRMSVGQQQRVGIIRALCQPFSFILLDEPVSHLDEANNRIAAEVIGEEAAARGAAIISTSVGNHLLISGAKTVNL